MHYKSFSGMPPPLTLRACACRLEAVLYALTAGARELLHLRTPALPDLHLACAAASLACSKPAPAAAAPAADDVAPQQPAASAAPAASSAPKVGGALCLA
jgi:hypothetical protein